MFIRRRLTQTSPLKPLLKAPLQTKIHLLFSKEKLRGRRSLSPSHEILFSTLFFERPGVEASVAPLVPVMAPVVVQTPAVPGGDIWPMSNERRYRSSAVLRDGGAALMLL